MRACVCVFGVCVHVWEVCVCVGRGGLVVDASGGDGRRRGTWWKRDHWEKGSWGQKKASRLESQAQGQVPKGIVKPVSPILTRIPRRVTLVQLLFPFFHNTCNPFIQTQTDLQSRCHILQPSPYRHRQISNMKNPPVISLFIFHKSCNTFYTDTDGFAIQMSYTVALSIQTQML